MRHLLNNAGVVVGSLLFMSLAANAQYRPPADQRPSHYYNQRYQDNSARSAIENTLAANRISLDAMMSADQWNYYAAETFRDFTPPSPETLFPWLANRVSSRSRYMDASHDPVSFTTWWRAISPYLQGSDY
jgi:hypothetical protein